MQISRMWIVAIALTTCTGPGCHPIRYEWQGPSDGFRRMDPDHDGKLTRAEWEQTSVWSRMDQTFLYPQPRRSPD